MSSQLTISIVSVLVSEKLGTLYSLILAKARPNKTFIVQALLSIISYNHQNIFIVQATDQSTLRGNSI